MAHSVWLSRVLGSGRGHSATSCLSASWLAPSFNGCFPGWHSTDLHLLVSNGWLVHYWTPNSNTAIVHWRTCIENLHWQVGIWESKMADPEGSIWWGICRHHQNGDPQQKELHLVELSCLYGKGIINDTPAPTHIGAILFYPLPPTNWCNSLLCFAERCWGQRSWEGIQLLGFIPYPQNECCHMHPPLCLVSTHLDVDHMYIKAYST